MEKKSPKILSKFGKSSNSKSATLSKDFKSKNSAGSSSALEDSSTLKSSEVSLSIKELKKVQDKQKKLLKQEMKTKQKQLKVEQKKYEKEQKNNKNKPSQNKPTNETVSEPVNIPNVIIDDEKRFSDGVKFRGKLVGIEPVMASRGDKMCQNALKNLRLLRRSTSSHKQRIIININLNGVQLRDQKTNDLVANHVINLISYITRDITDNRTFGYVYGTPDVGHQFIAIKSEKDSMFVMDAIGELFNYVYNKKKKERERQELESRNQFESIADNSESSGTLVDEKQPQNQGYDNKALMEFLKQQEKLSNHASNSQTMPAITQEFDLENENKYAHHQSTSAASKYNTLPPPLPSRQLESAQSNYSSNSNLNSYSYGAYSQSNYDTNYLGSNNYQSNISLATTTQDGSCSEMQQMQNVISSARKANDKFKGWQMFEDSNNNEEEYAANSLISERDDEDDTDSVVENNWANFESPPEPNYPPPPLYISNENLNEDVSIATTSQDTYTLTNQPQGDINQLPIQHSAATSTVTSYQKSNSLNNSQNTAFTVRLDTPPASARKRRSGRLSESSIDRQQQLELSAVKKQFESNFSNQRQQAGNEEFFDFDKVNNRRSFSKEYNTSFDSTLNRDSGGSRNDSRNSTNLNQFDIQFNDKFDDKFDSNFDKPFDNQQIDKQLSLPRRKGSDMQVESNRISLYKPEANRSTEPSTNHEIKPVKSANKPSQNSSFDSSFVMNDQKAGNAQSNRLSIGNSISNKKLSFDSNDFKMIDPNDKYAVFNEIGSMKFSIFSGDDQRNEEDNVFLTNNESKAKNQQANLSSLDSSHSQHNEFEDSFVSESSLNDSKNSSNTQSLIQQQLNQSMKMQTDREKNQNDSTSSSYTDPGLMVECHKKFLQERQEKLDQIDSIFESEKSKIRTRQRELNQEHLRQQKNLLNQQKAYQQEFYQRQKHQRQTILHQLQLQRLPVAQFDQCKLQLQQKLKDDQKLLQQEFIKKQQELKKRQTNEQNHILQQYKLLEVQYLEKQSELLNSDFEIEIDLPDVPNIFDNDESMQNEQALSKKFELSLKNEFDKLTNEIIQTTSSSLNSSPKMSERCSTACSITSSCSQNPFMMDELSYSRADDDTSKLNTPFTCDDESLKFFNKNLFEDLNRILNLDEKKIDWSNKGSSNSSANCTMNRKIDSDFFLLGNMGTGLNDSKDNSLEYYKNDLNKSSNSGRLSSASSVETNRSTLTLPGTFQRNTSNFVNLNKSLNESYQGIKMNTGYEKKLTTLNPQDSFRSQQQLNSLLPKSLNESLLPRPFVPKYGRQQFNSQRNDKLDPFNTQTIDTKLNEMNRIKELRQHTQQQLVSLTLPEGSGQANASSFSSTIQPVNNQIINQRPKEEQKRNTSIQELEELLGLSTSSLNKNSNNLTNQPTTTIGSGIGLLNMNTNLNSSLNSSLNRSTPNQSKTSGSSGADDTLRMFDNFSDQKENSSTSNFTNYSFGQSHAAPKTNSVGNLLADDNFKKNSFSFQDLRSDYRTEQFINSLQNTQPLHSTLQQKNSFDVFGTVVVSDLNNQKTAKKLFSHFGVDRPTSQDRNIFNSKEDPFKDDFFTS